MPINYGSVPDYLGLDGDLLDALVLGPRLPLGTRIRVKAWGAVTLTDRGMTDDKLICSDHFPDAVQRQKILQFFNFYAKCKGMLNIWRGRPGRNACEGWCEASRHWPAHGCETMRWRGPPAFEFHRSWTSLPLSGKPRVTSDRPIIFCQAPRAWQNCAPSS